jgi:hypothetical protein
VLVRQRRSQTPAAKVGAGSARDDVAASLTEQVRLVRRRFWGEPLVRGVELTIEYGIGAEAHVAVAVTPQVSRYRSPSGGLLTG